MKRHYFEKKKYNDGDNCHVQEATRIKTGKWIQDALRRLNESDLLNQVGRILAEQPELFPNTLFDMETYFEGTCIEFIEDQLATSSLVGADNEKAIKEWVADNDEWQMYFIIDIEDDVEMEEVHEGEWRSTNGRWSVNKDGVYYRLGDMQDFPYAVQKVYDQLQGD